MKFYVVKISWNPFFACFYSKRASIQTSASIKEFTVCSKTQFFRENVVGIAFWELRPGSNERYDNSTFYGPFRFFNEMADIQKYLFMKYKEEYQKSKGNTK